MLDKHLWWNKIDIQIHLEMWSCNPFHFPSIEISLRKLVWHYDWLLRKFYAFFFSFLPFCCTKFNFWFETCLYFVLILQNLEIFKKKMGSMNVSIFKFEWSSIVHNIIFVQSMLSKLIWEKIMEFYIIKCYKIIRRIHGLFDWKN